MKLLQAKKRFIKKLGKTMSKNEAEGEKKALQFWKESVKNIKLVHWRNKKLKNVTTDRLIETAYACYGM